MPATYSINNNTVYEATRVASVSDALNLLPDNTTKLITPRDARDAIFSAWESSVFKQTTGSASIEYIGIDRDNIRQKFLIGKKRLGGLDVLNSTLLNYNTNDTDIFFFNNKPGFTPSNTKIAFLAGTNSLLYPLAPYFESYSSTSSVGLNFDIVNNSGDIIIDSLIGRVSVNNVIFPTKLQTASASNGQILKYHNGSLIWGDNTISLANIGNSSSTTNIFGSPVLINGYNMEFTSFDTPTLTEHPIIATFGHIPTGQTFSNAPIVELVRQMLYPYLKPECSLAININGFYLTSSVAERGSPIMATLSWSIIKKSDPIVYSSVSSLVSPWVGNGYTSSVPGQFTLSSPPYYLGLTSWTSPGIISNSDGSRTIKYIINAVDSGDSNYNLNNLSISGGTGSSSSVTSSVELNLVHPFFYGLTATSIGDSSFDQVIIQSYLPDVVSSLNKSVDKKDNISLSLSGTGYIYFMYPSSYGSIVQILDQNGFDVTTSFIRVYQRNLISFFPFVFGPQFNANVSSPNSYWLNQPYIIYKSILTCTVVPSLTKWQFKFTP